MRFVSPAFLVLLLLLPITAWMGWPARGPARRREILALALRLLILSCLILSLAGMQMIRGGNNLAVVFLMDVSDSMPQEAINAEVDYVRSTLPAMSPDDRAALVLFGADALVERAMSASKELRAITSTPITSQTDLAEAIQLGLTLFPSGYAKRMILLSDGAQTSGDVLEAGQFAAASDVQLLVLPFVNQRNAEALIGDVELPTHLRPGETFDLEVSVQANKATRATVRVLGGDEILYERMHDLRRGSQTLTLTMKASQPGFRSYQVQIVPANDTFYQNNLMYAFTEVEGPPRILVVSSPPGEALPGGEIRQDETSALLHSLDTAGFQLDVVTPSHLAADLPALAPYDSIVLVNVPAPLLGIHQMENVRAYVHDLGGGLIVIGGPTSYGVGGYFHTPLEDALPVEMQIKDEQRRPSLGIVFIIDHSGSMSETSGGVEKLELAKEAAARSIQLLFPTDRVGVIAFDDSASWVVPMTELNDPSQVSSAIGSIRSGGGTDILAGLQAMAKVLPEDPAKVKHVILLTDGGADPTGIPELVQQLHDQNGITLSTVGVGNDAAPFLEDLATVGAGRYHFTNDASSIPSIFTEETSLATRAYLVEEPFFPTLLNSSPILKGIDETPRLLGYVASSPKDLAQVILQSDKKDPVLATWQYGLGRSVAFTSDATGRWAKDWISWEGFPTFWVQAVRYTISSSRESALEMSVETKGEQARVILDARHLQGEFLNGYTVQGNIIAPNGASQEVAFEQIAPGEYDAVFAPAEQGVYLFRLSGTSPDGQDSFAETKGWTRSYSPEYRQLESDPDLLVRLTAVTGGKVITADPADAFAHDLRATHAALDMWPWLILIAAILLPFDIGSRRLILTLQDWLRLKSWVAQNLIPRRVTEPLAQAAEQIQPLLKAKSRARQGPEFSDGALPQTVKDIQPTPSEIPVEKPHDSVKESKESAPRTLDGDSTTAASLLAHKKASQKKRDE